MSNCVSNSTKPCPRQTQTHATGAADGSVKPPRPPRVRQGTVSRFTGSDGRKNRSASKAHAIRWMSPVQADLGSWARYSIWLSVQQGAVSRFTGSGGRKFRSASKAHAIRRMSPVRADFLSRRVRSRHLSSDTKPLRPQLIFAGTPLNRYPIWLKLPRGLYAKSEMTELISIITTLNSYSITPIQKFEWSDTKGGAYDPNSHQVFLNQSSYFSKVALIDDTKATLVHEMAHGIYRKGFRGSKYWNLVFKLALNGRNYEIIDDSNYVKGTGDECGHPFDSSNEAFASAAHAYFLYADQFAAYIQNAKTPKSMRTFGKLVWCYMRERVFRGRTFTAKGTDSFAKERFIPLFDKLRKSPSSLRSTVI